MFQPWGKIAISLSLKHIEVLGQGASHRVVDGFQGTEQELIKQFIADTARLIEYNEWGVGLENLLTNLYEIEFILDQKAIDLAKNAIEECGFDYKDWACIEALVK